MTRHDLEDERAFLLRSLEDLDREHEAGDLSDEDHAVLRDGYVARTAAVLKSLDGDGPIAGRPGADPSPSDRPGSHATEAPGGLRPSNRRRRRLRLPTSPRRRIGTVAGVAAVVVVAVWGLVHYVGPRLPGESVTGSISLSGPQQRARTLAQAQTFETEGDAVDALKLYQSVLRQDPTQEQALAEVGWLEYQAGAAAKNAALLGVGESEEQQAQQVSPGAFAPHLYLGSMDLAQGDAAAAVAQYRQFLADGPPRSSVVAASSFITAAFTEDHEPVPALPVGKAAKGSSPS